jgi:hypothetical protein
MRRKAEADQKLEALSVETDGFQTSSEKVRSRT